MSVTLNKEANEACLEIDTKLYDFNKILESASEFTESCWVHIDGDPNKKLIIKIKPKSKELDPQEAANEFYNFILGLMKNNESPL